jgi:predicted ATP-dependent endonuclease of OLD family
MRIHSLTIINWRSISKLELAVKKPLILIGKNNHGKSNVLYAFLYLANAYDATTDDCRNNAKKTTVRCEIELSKDEQKKYSKYKTSSNLFILEKTFDRTTGESKYTLNNKPITDFDFFAAVSFEVGIGDSPSSDEAINTLLGNLIDLIESHVSKTRQRASINRVARDLSLGVADWGVNAAVIDDGRVSPKIEFVIANDSISAALRKQMGLRRALLKALLEVFANTAQMLDLQLDNTWLFIEEPELMMHPQAQREMAFNINLLADCGMNIIFTTHSSFFIDLSRSPSLCIIEKKSEKAGSKAMQYTKHLFSGKAAKKKFNMSYWINPDRGELFFARKVILVEGPTEKVALPKLAKKAGFSARETTIIDCAGKTNMAMYITLMNRYKIPYVVIFDRDHQKYRSANGKRFSTEQSKTISRKINPKFGKVIEFVNDIEEELHMPGASRKNKPFTALNWINDQRFVIPPRLLQKLAVIFAERR